MSIVIAIFDPLGESLFYADRKMVTYLSNGQVYKESEIEKIYWINDEIACGFTGIASWCLSLANQLVEMKESKVADLIDKIKTHPYIGYSQGSTFILMGTYDDHQPFIFTYKTSNQFQFEQDQALDAIASSSIALTNQCAIFLTAQFDIHNDIDLACIDTIEFAATQNPESISKNYDVIRLAKRNHKP